MDQLVLKYSLCPTDRVQLEPMVRRTGARDEILATHPRACSPADAVRLSERILSLLSEAFQVMGRPVDPTAARGHVERIRTLGTELRRALIPDAIADFLRSNPSVRHILFCVDPLLNGVLFDAIYLWDDFVAFRYATGKRLLTAIRPQRGAPAPPGPDYYRGCRLVDPGGLLSAQGATSLRTEEDLLHEQWDRLQHPNDRRLADMIDFEDVVAVSRADLDQALQHHAFVDLVCHHAYEEENPEKSGFRIIGEDVYTARNLLNCLGAGATPPLVLLSWACESAVTRGWDADWPNTDRLYGMVDAVIRSGIRHYISTVVKVPAERSPRLRLALYREIACGSTVGESFCAARRELRENQSDPLDGGTAFGLAFVLYGDPADAYFCAEGDRVDTEPIVACQEPGEGGTVCGRVVCRKETGFGHARCSRHWQVLQLTCSAGHPVRDAGQLSVCSKEGCRNTVCPNCPGYGQRLCWEHRCHKGHAIDDPSTRKPCSDPQGSHPEEKRSVCPFDDGWDQALCDLCLRTLHPSPQLLVCGHCGRYIDEHNPWAGLCEDPTCMQQLCATCKLWYDQTTYCPKPAAVRSRQERDTGWIVRLERRGQQDQQLASLSRLRSHLEIGSNFQYGLAANLAELRPWSVFPQLHLRIGDMLLPRPRTATVTESAIDLSAQLARALQQRWRLPSDRDSPAQMWEPPEAWRVEFQQANRLNVHVVKSLSGRRVLVAVATITPVDFKLCQGPVLVPADADHLAKVETTLRDECQRKWPGSRRQSIYLVVHSATGWALQGEHTDPPDVLTVFGEPQGGQWKLTVPPVETRPQYVQDFLRRLTPVTLDQRWNRIRRWIEDNLLIHDYVTVLKVQDALFNEASLGVSEKEVLDTFRRLLRTGRYLQYSLNDGQTALRPATHAEHAKYMFRRHWQDGAACLASALATAFAVGSFLSKNQSLGVGAILAAIGFPILNQLFKNLAEFLKQN